MHQLPLSRGEISEDQTEQNKSHAMAGIEAHPTSPHGCFFVMTGEIWLMLICSAGSRGVSIGPQNV